MLRNLVKTTLDRHLGLIQVFTSVFIHSSLHFNSLTTSSFPLPTIIYMQVKSLGTQPTFVSVVMASNGQEKATILAF